MEKLETLLDRNTALDVLSVYHDLKTRGFANRPEKWIEEGLSLTDATEAARAENQSRSLKNIAKNRGRTDITPSQVGFWTARGMTSSEAAERIRHMQARGLEHYERKYGVVEGFRRWKERQTRWRESLDEAERFDPSIRTRRIVLTTRASKESMTVFIPLMNWCVSIGIRDVFVGYGDLREWFLTNDEGDIFWYDFAVPVKKKIIEYHGCKFHPNKLTLTEGEWSVWRCLYSKQTADEKYRHDMLKVQLARQYGFDVLTIWDNEPVEEAIARAKEFIG